MRKPCENDAKRVRKGEKFAGGIAVGGILVSPGGFRHQEKSFRIRGRKEGRRGVRVAREYAVVKVRWKAADPATYTIAQKAYDVKSGRGEFFRGDAGDGGGSGGRKGGGSGRASALRAEASGTNCTSACLSTRSSACWANLAGPIQVRRCLREVQTTRLWYRRRHGRSSPAPNTACGSAQRGCIFSSSRTANWRA